MSTAPLITALTVSSAAIQQDTAKPRPQGGPAAMSPVVMALFQ